jgi:hypothetical protein
MRVSPRQPPVREGQAQRPGASGRQRGAGDLRRGTSMREDDPDELAKFMEKAKRNLSGPEGTLVRNGYLTASRFAGQNSSEVVLQAVGDGIPRLDPPKNGIFQSGTYSQVFFRAMAADQWASLSETKQLVMGADDYCGVCQTIAVAMGFFNGTSGAKLDLKQHYLVQFSVKSGTDAYKYLTAVCPQKAEKKGMSWGLGPQNHGGQGGGYFNGVLKTGTMKFDLIAVRLPVKFKRTWSRAAQSMATIYFDWADQAHAAC